MQRSFADSSSVPGALKAGAIAGSFGGFFVFAVEAVDRIVTLWPSFNSPAEPLLFGLYLAPAIFFALAAGLVLGPALVAFGLFLEAFERLLSSRFGRAGVAGASIAVAALVAALCTLAVDLLCRNTGIRSPARMVNTISLYFLDADAPVLSRLAHAAAGWALPVVFVGAFVVALAIVTIPKLVTVTEGRVGRFARYAAIPLALAVVGLYAFDSRFEYARYDMFLHVPASILQCVAASLAATIGFRLLTRPSATTTRSALAILAFAVVASGFVWLHFGSNENLKALLWRRSVIARRVYAAAAHFSTRDSGVTARAFADAGPSPEPAAVPADAPPSRARRFVLVAVDTLRADRMSLYGYDRPTTPAIERHARTGLVFDACYSQGTNTAVAFSAMQTSASRGDLFEPDRERLFVRLKRAGYATAQINAVREDIWLRAKSSSRAYRRVILDGIDEFPHELGEEFWDADKVTDAAIAYLSSLPPDAPSATWVHYFDPHTPRRKMAPFDYGDTASDKYDTEVAFSDREVGRLLDWMASSGFLKDTIVILVADHGEAFLEHGMDFHGNRPYQEQVHIPLVVWAPGLAPGRTSSPASIVDIAPTVLESLGQPPFARMEGQTLLAPIPADRPIFSETPLNIVDGPFFAFAVTRNGWRLIYDVVGNTTELYDLERDPTELHNLADFEPERVASMRATLDHWLATTRPVMSADEALELVAGQ